MYIDTLQLTDFKSFTSTASLRFAHPSRPHPQGDPARPAPLPNVTVLIGENGAGKSSVLKAICLGVLYEMASTFGIRSLHNVRRVDESGAAPQPEPRPQRAQIVVEAVGDPAMGEAERLHHALDIRLIGDLEKFDPVMRSGVSTTGSESGSTWETLMEAKDLPAYFIVAYGADRQIELPENYDRGTRSTTRHERELRLASLLDPGPFTLIPLGSWLAKSARKDEVLSLLRGTLPDDGITPRTDAKGKELDFDVRGVRLPLTALSDGYRAFIGWVADLLYHLAKCAPSDVALDQMPGVVLVDEIDLHLHPRWQQQVIERVAETFPRLQFVVTTHSPLIIGGLRKQNVLHVEQGLDGTSHISDLGTEVWGRTPNQLLLDPIFGLEHTRDEAFMTLLRTVEERALGGDIEAAQRLNALIAYGGAAVDRSDALPEWVRAAARRRDGA